MRIVVCGPAHSGKSVLFTAFNKILPQGYTGYIIANPDGEGLAGNNSNQNMIQLVRKKGRFNDDFLNYVIKRIGEEADSFPIFLIDTGGKRTPENEKIFSMADACIIISSDEREKEEWKKFVEKLNLKILAVLDSRIHGEDEIIQTEPYIEGIITALERGTEKNITPLIRTIIEKIKTLTISEGLAKKGAKCLNHESTFDMTVVARELGLIDYETGNNRWDSTRIHDIYDFLRGALIGRKDVSFFESRPIWLTALSTQIAEDLGVESFSFYEPRRDMYVPSKKMRTEPIEPEYIIDGDIEVYKVLPDEPIKVIKVESENETLISIYGNSRRNLILEDADNIILPEIDQNKKVYFNGRIPSWFVSCLIRTYGNREKAILQMGAAFFTIASADEQNIGMAEQNPSEINFLDVDKRYMSYRRRGDINSWWGRGQ